MALLIMQTAPVSAVELTITEPVVKGLEVTLSASLSASSNYYLQGALRAQSSSKYFGETKNRQGSWIDYVSSPDKDYIVSNFFLTEIIESTWSGKLSLRYKTDDTNYFGPGLYDLKLRRYTGNSTSSAGESNTLTITLTEPLPTLTPTQPPVTPTPSATQAPTSTPDPSALPSLRPSLLPSPKISPSAVATVAGTTTEIDLSSFGRTTAPSIQSKVSIPRMEPGLRYDRLRQVLVIGGGISLFFAASYIAYQKYLLRRKVEA